MKLFAVPLLAAAPLLAVPAAAQPSPDELRALALAGDIPAVEAAFDEALDAFRAGDLAGDDLRTMTEALMVTHPDIEAFVEAWLAAEPESPHAHAVMAFQLQDEGFRLRGPETVAWTYPDALAAFDNRIADAMDLALQAVRLAPDDPPAIDAVLNLQVFTKELSRPAFDAFVRRSMEATHDRGVLLRAAGITLPQWGGGGAPEAAQLCETYAPMVQGVEGYTPQVCLADVFYFQPFGTERYVVAPTVLEAAPSLFGPEIRAGAMLHQDPSGADAELLHDLILDPGFADLDLAKNFDRNIAAPRGWPPLYMTVYDRAQAQARERLAYDPKNLAAIDLLFQPPQPVVIEAGRFPPDRDLAEAERLARARIEAAPYDPASWSSLAGLLALAVDGDTPRDPDYEVASVNMVAYSNNRPSYLEMFAMNWSNLFRALPSGPERDEVACEVVRADRLLREMCGWVGGSEWSCSQTDFSQPYWQPALDHAAADNLCAWDREAPLPMIAFRPRPLPEE